MYTDSFLRFSWGGGQRERKPLSMFTQCNSY